MARKSKRGGAGAPQHCKVTLKSCLRGGPALSASTGRTCFKAFNSCRSKKKRSGGKGKRR
jgi:hypothetical protein